MGILKGKGIDASDNEVNQIIDSYKERHFLMKDIAVPVEIDLELKHAGKKNEQTKGNITEYQCKNNEKIFANLIKSYLETKYFLK